MTIYKKDYDLLGDFSFYNDSLTEEIIRRKTVLRDNGGINFIIQPCIIEVAIVIIEEYLTDSGDVLNINRIYNLNLKEVLDVFNFSFLKYQYVDYIDYHNFILMFEANPYYIYLNVSIIILEYLNCCRLSNNYNMNLF